MVAFSIVTVDPATLNVSVPSSSYSKDASFPEPKYSFLSSLIVTSPPDIKRVSVPSSSYSIYTS